MTTDITELAQRMKAAAEKAKHAGEAPVMPFDTRMAALNAYLITACPDNVLAVVEALEKAQTVNTAAEKLVRCKGRYHSEQNYRALATLFGVTTPDLPPIEHENVHYADAAEVEIAALRQRIAELEESHAQVIQSRDHYKRMSEEGLKQLAESRTFTVKLPHLPDDCDRADANFYYMKALADAGIKWEAE